MEPNVPIFTFSYIDRNNPSGIDPTYGPGTRFTPTADDITSLTLEDDDRFLDSYSFNPDATPAIVQNDPSSLGTAGFEPGETALYMSIQELTGSDGSSGAIVMMANYLGSGVQGYASTIPLVPGVTYTVGDMVNDYPIPYTELGATCFANGTVIRTADGDRLVEDLRCGDMVATRDHGLQAIRWTGSRPLSAEVLAASPNLRPIRIKAGALGNNTPSSDLLVSPQHRVLVRSKTAQRMFGTEEVLVAAKQLLPLEGIDIAEDVESVEYFHILFDRHEVVISNGAETESLYTGPEALKSVGTAAREEIFALFPELRDRDHAAAGARVLASGRMGRKLAMRHARHGKALVH